MMLTKFFSAVAAGCALALVPCCWAWGASVALPVDFQIDTTGPTTSELDLEVTAFGFSDSDVSSLSGNVLGLLTLDLQNLAADATAIRFDGGSIDATDVAFRLPQFFTQVFIDGMDIGGTLRSLGGGSNIVNSKFPTQDHELVLNRGILDARGTIIDDTTIMLEEDPIFFTYPDEATLTVAQIASSGLRRTFEAKISLPVDDQVDIEGQSATLTVMGQVNATTTFEINFGDYNGDLQVDGADYTVWRDSFGATGSGLAADGNGDEVVDEGDYLLWRENWGNTALLSSSLGGILPVPEPSSGGLLAILCAVGLVGGTVRLRVAC